MAGKFLHMSYPGVGGDVAKWLESPTLVPETWVQFPEEPPPGLPKPFIPLICKNGQLGSTSAVSSPGRWEGLGSEQAELGEVKPWNVGWIAVS